MTTILASDHYKAHDTGPGHPEQPARYDAVMGALAPLFDSSVSLAGSAPRSASDDDLALVHTRSYIDLVTAEIALGRRQLSTGDTTVSARSLEIARYAAGAALDAVDAVVTGAAQNAFCPVRPPGHHASPARGMGFCLFNNVAIAARYAQRHHGLARILIVDWDVHHGNGTQDTFYRDGSVFFFSTHQWPWYPGTGAADETGEGPGLGTTMNRPLPAGSGGRKVLKLYGEDLRRAAAAFQPDLVLISAGFDSREGDPLGDFTLTDVDFVSLTRILLEIAGEHSNGRLVSVLEGGYNLSGLASATAAHVATLAGCEATVFDHAA